MADKLHLLFCLLLVLSPLAWGQNSPGVLEKNIELQLGIDVVEKVDFDYSPKIRIGNEELVKLVLTPNLRQIIFKGLKQGPATTVTVRDNLGDVRIIYKVQVK